MANNSIIMSLDIRKNNNALSKCYGHYFAEVHRLGTLSTYALAKHMSEHNNLFGEEELRLILGKLARCIIEMISQGRGVKLDGLGTFYPTVQNVEGGAADLATAQQMGAQGLVEGIHIRFNPESEDLRDLTYKAMKRKCTLRLENVVESTPVTQTVDGEQKIVRRNRVFTPVSDFAYNEEQGSDSGSGGDDEPRP